jgi:hypothetical protein
MKTCCNCGKEAMIFPYVCVDCLSQLKKPEKANKVIAELKGLVNTAIEILNMKGFEEEAKTLKYMLESEVEHDG